jgi:hypothetical protein
MDGAAGSNQRGGGGGGARAPGAEAGDGDRALLMPHAFAAASDFSLNWAYAWPEVDKAWLEALDYVGRWAERGGGGGPPCAAMVRRALFNAATGVCGDGLLDSLTMGQAPNRNFWLAFAAFGVSRAYVPPSFLQALVSGREWPTKRAAVRTKVSRPRIRTSAFRAMGAPSAAAGSP